MSEWKVIKAKELILNRAYMVNCPKFGKIYTRWGIYGHATKPNWCFSGVGFAPTHYFDVPELYITK